MAVLHSKNTFISTINKIKIVPGSNIIPIAKIEELEKNSFYKTQLKLKHYTVSSTSVNLTLDDNINNTVETMAVAELGELPVKEASRIIKGDDKNPGILDIKTLQKIKQSEKRKKVLDAVDQQIQLLFERDDEESD